MEMAQPKPDPEELRKEVDKLFEADEVVRAKFAFEKAIAASPEEANAYLEGRVRLCAEKIAPLKRATRLVRLTETQECAVCGIKSDRCVSANLMWPVAVCEACDQRMRELSAAQSGGVAAVVGVEAYDLILTDHLELQLQEIRVAPLT